MEYILSVAETDATGIVNTVRLTFTSRRACQPGPEMDLCGATVRQGRQVCERTGKVLELGWCPEVTLEDSL